MKKTLFIILTVVTTNMFAQNVAIKGMTYKFESKATHGMRLTDAVRKSLSENEQLTKELFKELFDVTDKNELTVHFVHNRWDINESEQIKLDKMLEALKPEKDSIYISGYIDKCTGTTKRNTFLLQKRMDVIKDYLIEHGINPTMITIVPIQDKLRPFDKPEENSVEIIFK